MVDRDIEVLVLRDRQVDLVRRRVVCDGRSEALSERECALLRYLAERPGKTVSRDELLERVWGYAPSVASRAADTAVARLRQKVERDPHAPVHLLTVHGDGYRFEPFAPTASRPRQATAPSRGVVTLASCTVDLDRLEVRRRDGRLLRLTATEAGLLARLAGRHGGVCSRIELARGLTSNRSRAVDQLVARLRHKIEPDPTRPAHLVAVRGKGYRLLARPADAPGPEAALVLCRIEGLVSLARSDPGMAERTVARVTSCLARLDPGAFAMGGIGQFGFAFRSVADALRWCGRAQRALLHEPWPADLLARPEAREVFDEAGEVVYRGPRLAMAVHFGPNQTIDGPVGRPLYAGATATRVQEVIASAAGGQIWITDAAWQRADAAARGAFRARKLGKSGSLGHVWALVPEAIRSRRLPSVRARATWSASAQPTSFVGRLAELDALWAWWQRGGKLVTIVGAGGMGKTRLARRFARGLPGGAWWCGLAATRNGEEALERLAQILGLPYADPTCIGQVLHNGRAVVVLDKVEQLADFAPTVEQVVAAAREARWIVTSRRPLELECEELLELGPLTPDAARTLFSDRALVEHGASVDDDAVAELVDRLDRLPLAIELAAGRTSLLSPSDLVRRLPERLALLSGPGTDRHATMRAAIEWSWSLAEPALRNALVQLSSFRASFTLEDAEAVLDPDGTGDVLTTLDALQRQSLVTMRRQGAGRRLELLQSIREFVREKVDVQHADLAERYVRRMASYGSQQALDATYCYTLEQLHGLIESVPDLLAAADLALEAGWIDAAVRCGRAACRALQVSSRSSPRAMRVTDRLLALDALEDTRRADVLCERAWACDRLGQEEHAREAAMRGLSLHPRWQTAIDLHRTLARVHWNLGDPGASLTHEDRALDLALRHNDPARAGIARGARAQTLFALGRVDEAHATCREAIRELEACGSSWKLAYQRYIFGWLLARRGRRSEARATLAATLPVLEALPDLEAVADVHRALGVVDTEAGALEDAHRHFRAAVDVQLECGVSPAIHHALLAAVERRLGQVAAASASEARALASPADNPAMGAAMYANLAVAALEGEDPDRALDYVRAARERSKARWIVAQLYRIEGQALLAKGDPAAEEALRQAREAVAPIGMETELVEVLCLQGRLAVSRGDPGRAREVLAEAEALAGPDGQHPRTARGRALARLRAVLSGAPRP